MKKRTKKQELPTTYDDATFNAAVAVVMSKLAKSN